MTIDPLRLRALDVLARGHRLYPAASRPAVFEPAGAPAWHPVAGAPAQPFEQLAAELRRAGATDAELGGLLVRAGQEQQTGRRDTRMVLDDARADTLPGADTPLGQREALRRSASRLRAQHRRIRRSRRIAGSLTRRLRGLHYRADHRIPRPAASPIPMATLRYANRLPPGRVRRQILAALDRLGIAEPRARRNWLRGYLTLIQRESSGRPSAVATEPAGPPGPTQPDGRPLGYARGLTQTLPATFARYHQPGTSVNIYDPIANICASMNYVMHRYGVRADGADLVALVQQADATRPPRGY